MQRTLLVLLVVVLLIVAPAIANDVTIDSTGNIATGTSAGGNLEVTASSGEHGIVGITDGTGAPGVSRENTTFGNYGRLGDYAYGVYGYSPDNYAGYFQGNTKVTGDLTVDGSLTSTHAHSGSDMASGTIAETYIDLSIARDIEIMPTVLSLDGSGSGLNADLLDGQDAAAFATATSVNALDSRVTTLENQSGGSQDPVAIIINAAAFASEQTVNRKPELEIWMRAAQKAWTLIGGVTELDTDGDGLVVAGADLTNDALAVNGVVTTFVAARHAMNETSPWNAAKSLWVNGAPVANQAACNNRAATNAGQITLCPYPIENQQIEVVFVSVTNNTGNIIYQNIVHGETEQERIAVMLGSVEKNVLELEKWMRAADTGGMLTEIDTDGDGIVLVGTDLPNEVLAVNHARDDGLCELYVSTKVAEKSPWLSAVNLWQAAPAGPGVISCTHPFNGPITLVGQDKNGYTLYQKTVNGITLREKIDVMLSSANNSASELEKWMRAADTGGMLTEIDTDGDGIVLVGTDLPNEVLAVNHAGANGLCQLYVATKMNERSPWGGGHNLWQAGPPFPGIISCTHPSNGPITLEGSDNDGYILYQKTVHGITPREKIDVMLSSAQDSASELEQWIRAADRGWTDEGMLTEIDTDGDGSVVYGTDLPNHVLAVNHAGANGLCQLYVASKMNERSPWGGGINLWQAAAAGPGYISCTHSSDGPITLEGRDNDGFTLYQKTVSGITPRERIDSVLKSLDETLPVLDKWIIAGQKAGTAEGPLTEIDTDGDGIVLMGTDLPNDVLAATGVITQLIIVKNIMSEYSPWSPYSFLWVNGHNAANQAACNSIAAGNPGQITVCYYPSENEAIQAVFVAAVDGNSTLFYQKIIAAY